MGKLTGKSAVMDEEYTDCDEDSRKISKREKGPLIVFHVRIYHVVPVGEMYYYYESCNRRGFF